MKEALFISKNLNQELYKLIIMNCIMTILSVFALFYIVKQLHFRWVIDNVDIDHPELRKTIEKAKRRNSYDK